MEQPYSIEYNGNGHTGGNVPSGQSAYAGASVTLRTNTGSLSKTGYKLVGWNSNASGTGPSYSLGETTTMPARNMILYAMWEREYALSVTNYFDQGYLARYSNPATAILGHIQVVADKYSSILNLKITSTASVMTSCADECKTAGYGSIDTTTIRSACVHGGYHLTTGELREGLLDSKGAGTPTSTKVLWTGHILDDHEGDRSNSDSSNHTVIITPCAKVYSNYDNLPESDVNRESRYELFHELGHQIGLYDHYCFNEEATTRNKCSNLFCLLADVQG